MTSAQESIARLSRNIERVIIGKTDAVKLTIIALIAQGHLLIEDVPGVGKTSLAKALAKSLDLGFRRIQFTNDILPSDITGVSIYDQEEKRFHFQKGPLFANIVLADEINRSTPRTQSALLEAMNEKQVSVDNTTYSLDDPFMVIATQNPTESYGAYPLPESQLDRFMMFISMGYPSIEDERQLLTRNPSRMNPEDLSPVLDRQELLNLQQQVEAVKIEPVLVDYILNVITETRNSDHLELGVSPRGGLILQKAAKASALFHGRNYCIPDDIKEQAVPVLAHRVIPKSHHSQPNRRTRDTAAVISNILDAIEIPV
jgi:MoxR-like ATPase